MITRIWIILFIMISLVTFPLLVIQSLSQKESVELVFDIASRASSPGLLQDHLALLKLAAKTDPQNSEHYRAQFENAAESLQTHRDLELIRENVIASLMKQTLRNAILVTLAAVLISFFLARTIVRYFQKLVRDNQQKAIRLEKMGSLEAWQRMARILVHELRAPMTPIKLVSSDIESKYKTLKPEAFSNYLHEGATLIQDQVATVEAMSESFIRFAKLPEPRKEPQSVSRFLQKFVDAYGDFRPGTLKLSYLPPTNDIQLNFDAALFNQLFFNLLKNACEANPRSLTVVLRAETRSGMAKLMMSNNGKLIPPEMEQRMFELYVSQKPSGDDLNFGLGLAISKKIAFDHGGDLRLSKNNSNDGVEFELEVPQ